MLIEYEVEIKMGSNKNPLVSIIVLDNYHPNKEKFLSTINSYVGQNYDNYEIIIALYNKDDKQEVPKLLKDNGLLSPNIRFFSTKKNLGYARGNNCAVFKARGDFIIISNPDIKCDSDFISKLMNSMQNLMKSYNSDKIILQPHIYNNKGTYDCSSRIVNFLGFSLLNRSKNCDLISTDAISGCCFLIKKERFQELSGFDSEYFMYHEDIDFSLRAAKCNYLQFVDNSIGIYHLRTNSEFKLNNFKYYYHERNRIIMTLQHSKKKIRMGIAHLCLEPLEIVFALQNGFFFDRVKVYRYILKNLKRFLSLSGKENDYLDTTYDMSGIFNEINKKSIVFKFISFYAKILYYFYR